MSLADMSFRDPGSLDTHTLTIDWGDGTPLDTTTLDQERGGGTIDAAHSSTLDGSTTVTVCVDDGNDGGCDIRELDVRLDAAAPAPDMNQAVAEDEGTSVRIGVGFTATKADRPGYATNFRPPAPSACTPTPPPTSSPTSSATFPTDQAGRSATRKLMSPAN